LIAPILQEKDEAIALARESLAVLPAMREGLDELEYLQLELSLQKSVQAALLWRHLTEVFFTARCLEARTLQDHHALLQASARLFDVTRDMRRDFGKNAWPTVAGPYRGIGCEDFVVQAHRVLLYRFIGQALPVFGGSPGDPETVQHFYPRDNIEDFWRVLLLQRPPESDADGAFTDVVIEHPLETVEISAAELVLRRVDGGAMPLPLYYPGDWLVLGVGKHRVNLGLPGWEGRSIGLMKSGD
jgi:hypothetical protein